MPRKVRLARANPSRTAASKPSDEAAVIFVTLATAINSSLKIGQPENKPAAKPVDVNPSKVLSKGFRVARTAGLHSATPVPCGLGHGQHCLAADRLGGKTGGLHVEFGFGDAVE